MKIIENIKTNRTEYSRLFWKSLAVIMFLGMTGMAIAWRIESYGRKMDAEVNRIRLEALQSHATPTSTPETVKPTLGK